MWAKDDGDGWLKFIRCHQFREMCAHANFALTSYGDRINVRSAGKRNA